MQTIGRLWGIESVCLRVFNAYGPGQHLPPVHAPVIPYFLRQSHQNGTLVIHGDGSQTRDYVYVDDVVQGMVAAATAPDIDRLTINIGSGREVSVRELVRMVSSVTGNEPEAVYNPRKDGGPVRMCSDISLARKKLGYLPTIPLEDGLKMTFDLDPRMKQTSNA